MIGRNGLLTAVVAATIMVASSLYCIARPQAHMYEAPELPGLFERGLYGFTIDTDLTRPSVYGVSVNGSVTFRGSKHSLTTQWILISWKTRTQYGTGKVRQISRGLEFEINHNGQAHTWRIQVTSAGAVLGGELLDGVAFIIAKVGGEEVKLPIGPAPIRAKWEDIGKDDDTPWYLDDYHERIQPVRYEPEGKLHLSFQLSLGPPRARPEILENSTAKITFTNLYKDDFVVSSVFPANVELVDGKSYSIEIDMDRVLRTTGAKINQNLYSVEIDISTPSQTFTHRMHRPIHFVRQKLLLIIPGVLGSRIGIKELTAPFAEKEAYPEFSLLDEDFMYLVGDENGVSKNTVTNLDLLQSFAGQDVYRVYDRVELKEGVSPVRLYRGGRTEEHRVKHAFVESWAYDWRKPVEEHVRRLLQDTPKDADGNPIRPEKEGPVHPAYKVPPTLEQIIHHYKNEPEYRFIDDKIAVAVTLPPKTSPV